MQSIAKIIFFNTFIKKLAIASACNQLGAYIVLA